MANTLNSDQLRQKRADTMERMKKIVDSAERASRGLTNAEDAEYKRCQAEFEQLTRQIQDTEAEEVADMATAREIPGNGFGGIDSGPAIPSSRDSGSVVRLTREQSMRQHVAERGYRGGADLDLDKMIRGMLIGDWRGADSERRALNEGTDSAGGVLVPSPLASGVIDLARAQTRVMQAGAVTVPMDSSTQKIARQTGDPALSWHKEAASIDESGLTFDSVTLHARTLPCLVKVSMELLEDVDDLDGVISRAVAQAIALELDRVALRGSGTAPEPKGIRSTTGVTITDVGENGKAPDWDMLLDAQGAVRGSNYEPNAAILAVRTATALAKLKDSTSGQYVAAPGELASVPRLPTTSIPVDLTHGTATDASEVYVGQWNQLMIGMRHTFSIKPLTERYLDTGEIGFFAYIRADVQLAQPSAFTVLDGITPAS